MRAFLFYVDDWLSSKNIKLMDAHEEKGYLRLLLAAVTEDDCGLPDDDHLLSVITELGKQWWLPTRDEDKRLGEMTSGQKIRKCFVVRDGRLYNERMLKEFLHQKEVKAERAKAGKTGGEAKARNIRSNVVAIAKQMPSNCQPNAQQMDKQNPTNDVCVYVSSSVLEQQQDSNPSHGMLGDESGITFRKLSDEYGIQVSEAEWIEFFEFVWPKQSFEQKLNAIAGLRARIKAKDYSLAGSTPRNFVEKQYYGRKIREDRDSERQQTVYRPLM